jgi:hypothetical protein
LPQTQVSVSPDGRFGGGQRFTATLLAIGERSIPGHWTKGQRLTLSWKLVQVLAVQAKQDFRPIGSNTGNL